VAWTYDADLDERKDEVRFLVGDTDTTIPLVQDEEIEYVLTQYVPADGKPAWLAAAHVCDAIAGKFARKMQQTLGPLSASNQQQWEHYVALAAHLRMLYATNGLGGGEGYVPGFIGFKPAGPILSGGGPTVLGGSQYSNPPGGGA
jgi:hypothetical protein